MPPHPAVAAALLRDLPARVLGVERDDCEIERNQAVAVKPPRMSTKMITSVENISPACATNYLTRNIKNRRLREATVRQFAREMEHGRWYLHHQGIAFNEDGDLIDGQHRLTAIILAGTSVPMNVTRGVRDNGTKAAHFIDIGNKRSIGDQLAITTGLKNANSIVAAARCICELSYSEAKAGTPTLPIIEKVFQHYLEEIELCYAALQGHSALKKAPVVAAMAFCMKAYPGVLRFAESVGTGEMLSANSPELILRNYFIDARADGSRRLRTRDIAETVSGAARAYLEDKTLSRAARAPKALEYFKSKQKKVVDEIRELLAVSIKKMPQ